MDSRLLKLRRIAGRDNATDDISERLCVSRDVTPISYKWIDLYGIPPYLADYVVKPLSIEALEKIIRYAGKIGMGITVYGGGSGTVGGVIPMGGGIVIDMSFFDNIIRLDEESLTVEVESGIIAQVLENYLNKSGYTFRHFPQSFRSASIGGLIATRSTGQFSSKYGGIENFVVSIEAILPDGKILRTPAVPRRSAGPEVKNLFIGSEGIFGVITKAVLKIQKIPEAMKFQCFVYDNIFEGLDAIREIMQSGLEPPVVRLYNKKESELKFAGMGFGYRGCLLVLLYEGKREIVEAECSVSERINLKRGAEYIGSKLGDIWFENRFDTRHIMEMQETPGGISDAIEVSASWSRIKKIYTSIEDYFSSRNITLASHFSHAYSDGISSYNIFYIREKNEKKAIDEFKRVWKDIMKITVVNGGSISHHHGIGMVKNKMLPIELGEGYKILEKLKKALDPKMIFNRGKLLKYGK
jgi:alkyldihydroxyacetonephosphate synthase